MTYTVLHPNDYLRSAWSGGETAQIAIAPRGAVYAKRDFLWRLSIATVTLDESDFTPLPDYRRFSAVLDGGMSVSHDGGPQIELKPFDVHAFDGGANTHARGQCRDINLMARKGRCLGSLETMRLTARASAALDIVPGETLLLHAAQGSFTLSFKTDIIQVNEGCTLQAISDMRQDISLVSPKDAIVMLARITYQGEELRRYDHQV